MSVRPSLPRARLPSEQIIDEADRLLNQSFNDWLPTLLDALSDSATEGEAFSQSDSRFDQVGVVRSP